LSVKTAEPIKPKFCVGPHMTIGIGLWNIKIGFKFLENAPIRKEKFAKI